MKKKDRLDLKVGFKCNNNCRFCVIAENRNSGKSLDKTTEEIKKDLAVGKENGAGEVVFTGGEVTIRPDVFEIVSFARALDYEIIQIQTNGRMLYYKSFVRKLVDCGATEISPALHGHNSQLHDYLTRSPGSFKQTSQGIVNAKSLGLYVASNTVITKPNYEFLPDIAKLLVNLGVDQFQFAFVHPQGNAFKYFDSIVPLKSKVEPFVHRALDIGINAGVSVMAEAYPFCFMKGYESFCSERFIPETEIRSVSSNIRNFTEVRRNMGKSKGPLCSKCIYDSQCEGPWCEYPQKRGWEEFQPIG
ncbi:MAG: radical SAM protein [Candidatus Diapherotrites archaeon]|nr:radical SAM protein [Candidatus Diapherotrites archaeon]